MAKRFIETNYFKDHFVRQLPGQLKCFYIYLFLECSNAGIWNVELDVARLRCNIDESFSDDIIIEYFKDKILEIDNKQKWFLKNFVKVQHNGVLKGNNKAHIGAITELNQFGLLVETNLGEFSVLDKPSKPLASPLHTPSIGAKDMVKDIGKSKDNGKNLGPKFDFRKLLKDLGLKENFIEEWLMIRKEKKLSNTETAFKNFHREFQMSGIEINKLFEEYIIPRSWGGFTAKWLDEESPKQSKFKRPAL